MTTAPFLASHVDTAERAEVDDGIVVDRLHRSGPEPGARRALLVRFGPGAR